MKIVIFFLMTLIFLFKSFYNNSTKYRKKPLSEVSNYEKKVNKTNINFKRRLQTLEECETFFNNDSLYNDLNIHIDTLNFENDFSRSEFHENNQLKNLIINSMKKAAEILGSFLMIMYPVEITIQDNLENLGINYYDPNYVKVNVTGSGNYYFVIYSKISNDATEINLMGNKLAIGKPIIGDLGCSYPIYGLMTFNPSVLDQNYDSDYLKVFFLRQFTNIIAFNEMVFEDENNILNGILYIDEDTNRYYIQSNSVVEFAQNYYNCPELTNIEILKDDFGNFYWPERYLLGEYMTEEDYPEEKAISNFTLFVLKDLKYVRVKKYYTGGLMRFGKHKGCDFIKKSYNKDEIIFKNEFYYPKSDKINTIYEEPSCSSGRQSKTIFKLIEYSNIPGNFIYFSDTIGGLKSADYCPVPQYFTSEQYNVGHCSDINNLSDEERGESFSQKSFCALSSLLKNNSPEEAYIKAICFQMFCSDKSLTIKFGNDFLVCPREGGIIQGDGYKGALLCPDYNLICTGTEVCNNILDCIDKKSLEKENAIKYETEYDIQTTQVSSVYSTKIENEEFSFKGELSNNGLCPQFCFQCESPINNKNNKYSCVKCQKNYKLKLDTNSCINKIENCKEFNAQEICIECIDNTYGLVKNNENDETTCLKISDMQNEYLKFTEGDKDYYKKCSDVINNCKTCSSEIICTSCFAGYGLVDNNYNNCIELQDKYYFDSELDTYKLCSYKNTGCKTCSNIGTNDIICKECDSSGNFVLIYDVLNYCKLQTDITNDKTIFFDSNLLKYFSCSDSRYHSVKNCNTCHNKNKCDTCKNGYEIANSNELCISYFDINQNIYYKNNIDNKYYLCSDEIKGCEICENLEKCTYCYMGFDLDENDKCIPTALAITRYYLNNETGKYVSCTKIENCEECISSTECTKCKNGYELDNSSCKIIENKSEDDNDGDGKLKSLSIAAIVLGTVGFVVSIVAIVLVLFIKLFKKPQNISDPTESQNINNDPNEIVVKSNKRSLHNEAKE